MLVSAHEAEGGGCAGTNEGVDSEVKVNVKNTLVMRFGFQKRTECGEMSFGFFCQMKILDS